MHCDWLHESGCLRQTLLFRQTFSWGNFFWRQTFFEALGRGGVPSSLFLKFLLCWGLWQGAAALLHVFLLRRGAGTRKWCIPSLFFFFSSRIFLFSFGIFFSFAHFFSLERLGQEGRAFLCFLSLNAFISCTERTYLSCIFLGGNLLEEELWAW